MDFSNTLTSIYLIRYEAAYQPLSHP